MSTPPENGHTINPTSANGAGGQLDALGAPLENGAAHATEVTHAASTTSAEVTSSPSSVTSASSRVALATATADPPATAEQPAAAEQPATAVAYEPAPPPPPVIPPAPADGSPSPEYEEEEGMTMLEHLEELRVRIIVCAVALAIGLIIAALPVPFTGYSSLTWNVIAVVAAPAAGYLQFLEPGESFITYFKVALVLAAALAMPVLIHQLMAFVMPALLPHEKKYFYMALPGVMFSFVIGIMFGYMLVLPVAIGFLLTFGQNVGGEIGIDTKWGFGYYVGTVTTLLFWMGMAFQTPLIMFFLTKLRVLSVERLVRFRKYALILAFVFGAIITPTPDPLNQTIVSLPLYFLYEFGLLISRFAQPRPEA